MLMTWIFTAMIALSVTASLITGQGGALSAAVAQGAGAGISLTVSLAGSLCLWTGVGLVMETLGVTQKLSRLFFPVLKRLFPSTKTDPLLRGSLSANICANLLGLGNAATPMGIQAAQRLALKSQNGTATHELCRLIVLNTASIQLIPATVAAVRGNLGCQTPYDLLLPVWVTSLFSAGAGLLAAWVLGKLWKSQ